MLKRITIFSLMLLSIFFIACTSDIKQVSLGELTLDVEIADTYTSRAQGLSGREALAINQGLLFLWSQAGNQCIWMKDMKFAIDIIWIKDNQIVDLAQSVQPPKPGEKLETFCPKNKANKVLDVNAGMAGKRSIVAGN